MQTYIWGILCVALIIDIIKLKYSSSHLSTEEDKESFTRPDFYNRNSNGNDDLSYSSMKIKSGDEELKVSYDKGTKSNKKVIRMLIQYCSS